MPMIVIARPLSAEPTATIKPGKVIGRVLRARWSMTQAVLAWLDTDSVGHFLRVATADAARRSEGIPSVFGV